MSGRRALGAIPVSDSPLGEFELAGLGVDGRENGFGGQRKVPDADAGSVGDRVGYGGCGRALGSLTGADQRLVLARQDRDVDLGRLGEAQDGVALPLDAW